MHRARRKLIFTKVTGMDALRSLLVAGFVILLLAFSGCTLMTGPSISHQQSAINSTPVEKVEVFHFSGNHQCASCIAVGDLAERTVNASFGTELESGRLVFAHVNYDLPENAALATKYNVTGSSLWIGVYGANGFHREQDIRVWSLISDEEAYSSYLTELISKRLNGDLS
jgi:hypothetical protein